jgi:hypothetical protein
MSSDSEMEVWVGPRRTAASPVRATHSSREIVRQRPQEGSSSKESSSAAGPKSQQLPWRNREAWLKRRERCRRKGASNDDGTNAAVVVVRSPPRTGPFSRAVCASTLKEPIDLVGLHDSSLTVSSRRRNTIVDLCSSSSSRTSTGDDSDQTFHMASDDNDDRKPAAETPGGIGSFPMLAGPSLPPPPKDSSAPFDSSDDEACVLYDRFHGPSVAAPSSRAHQNGPSVASLQRDKSTTFAKISPRERMHTVSHNCALPSNDDTPAKESTTFVAQRTNVPQVTKELAKTPSTPLVEQKNSSIVPKRGRSARAMLHVGTTSSFKNATANTSRNPPPVVPQGAVNKQFRQERLGFGLQNTDQTNRVILLPGKRDVLESPPGRGLKRPSPVEDVSQQLAATKKSSDANSHFSLPTELGTWSPLVTAEAVAPSPRALAVEHDNSASSSLSEKQVLPKPSLAFHLPSEPALVDGLTPTIEEQAATVSDNVVDTASEDDVAVSEESTCRFAAHASPKQVRRMKREKAENATLQSGAMPAINGANTRDDGLDWNNPGLHDESDLESDFDIDCHEHDYDLPPSMTFALSYKFFDSDGLPFWRFSVYGGDDSTFVSVVRLVSRLADKKHAHELLFPLLVLQASCTTSWFISTGLKSQTRGSART